MPTPIENISVAEIKKYYPVTESLSRQSIDDAMNNVKNVTFLEMFGYALSNKIFTGEIEDSQDDNFMGFRLFVALNIAAFYAGEVFKHTNAGLKAVTQPNWQNPGKEQRNTEVRPLSDAITSQFLEAKRVLKLVNETPKNNFEPYSSFDIEKI